MDSMQNTTEVLKMVLVAVFFVYLCAFATVGACLVGSAQPVAECRDNMAGALVYKTVSVLL